MKFEKINKPIFKMFSNESTHSGYIHKTKINDETPAKSADREAITFESESIDKFRREQPRAYRESLIIIVSDHDGNYNIARIKTPKINKFWKEISLASEETWSDLRANALTKNIQRSSPMILIKMPNEMHSETIFNDDRMISNADIPEIISNVLGVKSKIHDPSVKISSYIPDTLNYIDDRSIYTFDHAWKFNPHSHSYNNVNKVVAVVSGDMRVKKNWETTLFTNPKSSFNNTIDSQMSIFNGAIDAYLYGYLSDNEDTKKVSEQIINEDLAKIEKVNSDLSKIEVLNKIAKWYRITNSEFIKKDVMSLLALIKSKIPKRS